MIPTIEQIIEDLLSGSITKSQAVTWLLQHSENANQDLRDYFAAKAMQGIISGWDYEAEMNSVFKPDAVSKRAYSMADAMLKARNL